MNRNTPRSRLALPAVVANTMALVATSQSAEASDGHEPALARSANDSRLQWGPCPAFLPAGCGIAILHGDPSKPNADILLRLPGRSEIPLHTHTSAERMVLVGGELLVTYEGQAEERLTPGMYAYGPAGRPHGGRCASEDPCLLMIAFEGPVDAIPMTADNRAD
jgi:quercetin dioxygenase-like cupin family protein